MYSAAVLDRDENVQSLEVVGYLHQNSSNTKKEICDCNCHQRMIIGSQIAAEMRDGLWNVFHLTSSAGIAHNMLISKIASGLHKPNLQTTVNPDDALDLLHSLELRKIAGIGSATNKKLRSVGITTVKELARIPLAVLKTHFLISQARMLFQCSRGIDDNDIITAAKPKSIGVEDSFSRCCSMIASKKRISDLIKHVLPRLTDGCEFPQTVKLTIIKHDSSSYKRESKQCSVPCTFYSTKDSDKRCNIILDTMLRLLRKIIDTQKPFRLRLFGITFTNFKDKPPVASLSISSYLHQSNSKNYNMVNKKSLMTIDNIVRDDSHPQTSSNCNHNNNNNKSNEELLPDVVPDGIDLEVFSQLPQQMKKELFNEWGKRNRDIPAAASPKRNDEGTILHYFGRS